MTCNKIRKNLGLEEGVCHASDVTVGSSLRLSLPIPYKKRRPPLRISKQDGSIANFPVGINFRYPAQTEAGTANFPVGINFRYPAQAEVWEYLFDWRFLIGDFRFKIGDFRF